VHHVDQFLSSLRAFAVCLARWIDDVETNVILDNLRHEAIDRAAHGGDEMQHVAAADFFLKRAFHGLDLTANTADTLRQFRFLSD
jgi:hypothetical protein